MNIFYQLLRFQKGFFRLIEDREEVNGSANDYWVTHETNLLYHALVSRFGERTGVPVLLNTSLNLRGEPTDDTPDDALGTF